MIKGLVVHHHECDLNYLQICDHAEEKEEISKMSTFPNTSTPTSTYIIF